MRVIVGCEFISSLYISSELLNSGEHLEVYEGKFYADDNYTGGRR